MIGMLLRWVFLPLRALYFAYAKLRNVRKPKRYLMHRVPDRFTMHRPSGWASFVLPQTEAHYFDYLIFWHTLEKQKGTDRIVLQIPEMRTSWSQTEELARRIARVRAENKTVLAYSEGGNLKTLFLMAAADGRWVAPNADFLAARPSAEPFFVKGLLDRLGVRMEVLTAGRFKSAGEMFTRNRTSAPARQALLALIKTLRSTIETQLAATPGLTEGQAAALLRLCRQRSIVSSEELARAGFVTGLCPQAHLAEEVLRSASAADAQTSKPADTAEPPTAQAAPSTARAATREPTNDEPTNAPDQEGSSEPERFVADPYFIDESALVNRYRRTQLRLFRKRRPFSVAIVSMHGNMINGKRGESIRPELISTAAYQDLFEGLASGPEEAVFVHIDSPGGSSSGAELLYQSIRSLAERKPVFAVLGSVAASGGYYIATAAEKIFAANSSITGSVGVFAMHTNASGLYRRVGIGRERLAFDPTQDIFSESAALSPAARKMMKDHIARTYQLFLERVAEARQQKVSEVRRMAEGRVWTGAEFRQAGLVDEDLDLLSAVEWYRESKGYPKETEIQLHYYPEIRTDLRSLTAKLPFGAAGKMLAKQLPQPAAELLRFYRPVLRERGWTVLQHAPVALLLRNL